MGTYQGEVDSAGCLRCQPRFGTICAINEMLGQIPEMFELIHMKSITPDSPLLKPLTRIRLARQSSDLPGVASSSPVLRSCTDLGNGVLTIARGTAPLALYGLENYGYLLGLIGTPARLLQAGAPFGFSLLIDHFGAGALFSHRV
jgi:hypothetical protein